MEQAIAGHSEGIAVFAVACIQPHDCGTGFGGSHGCTLIQGAQQLNPFILDIHIPLLAEDGFFLSSEAWLYRPE